MKTEGSLATRPTGHKRQRSINTPLREFKSPFSSPPAKRTRKRILKAQQEEQEFAEGEGNETEELFGLEDLLGNDSA